MEDHVPIWLVEVVCDEIAWIEDGVHKIEVKGLNVLLNPPVRVDCTLIFKVAFVKPEPGNVHTRSVVDKKTTSEPKESSHFAG